MAGGANKRFMEDKSSFLRNNVIEVSVTDGSLQFVADHHHDANKAVLAKVGRVENAGGDGACPVSTDHVGLETTGL